MKEIIGSYNESLAVKCENGIFVGHKYEGGKEFLGIPFAKQPVGSLRFRRPEKPEPSDKVYAADEFGPAPMQLFRSDELVGEDCLNLNIWVGSEVTEKAPVMVWIHGGGFVSEAARDPLYNLDELAKTAPDIVFLSIEYRVELFGFIDLSEVPGGEGFEGSCNLGLLDQVEALKWINRNIAGFGGDPEQVTIFGESAGGTSVSLLPIIEGTKGLFKRVIAESGSMALTDNMDHMRKVTQNFLKASGCKTVQELQALDKKQILEAHEKTLELNFEEEIGYFNFAAFDGIVLPNTAEEGYAKWGEELKDIDLLMGSLADETLYYAWEEKDHDHYADVITRGIKKDMETVLPEEREAIEKFLALDPGDIEEKEATVTYYQDKPETRMIVEFYNDVFFRIGSNYMGDIHSDAGGKSYMYYMTYPRLNEAYGVMHASELPFLMSKPYMNLDVDTANSMPQEQWPEDGYYTLDVELTSEIKKMWTNFARTGDPSTEAHKWLPYSHQDKNYMVFGEELHMEKNILQDRDELIKGWCHKYGIMGFRPLD